MKKLRTGIKTMEMPDNTALVDLNTGEEVSPNVKVHKYMAGKEEFYLTYTYLINALMKDMTIAEVKVFSYLLEHYGAGTMFSITKTIKLAICKNTGLSNINTVSNVIGTLQTKNIPMLFKKGRGTYIINPRYAFKGSSKNRDKELQAIIELGCTNC